MIDDQDTALIIEGGGMRAAYTAPVIVKLLQEDVQFGWVGGISAGSSHTMNFLSRDVKRARDSFTSFAADPNFGGARSVLRGTGYFNAQYMYQDAVYSVLPYDYDAFLNNPAQMHIEATRADTGETRAWKREDIHNFDELALAVRASSTLPGFMNIPFIDGHPYVDGAFGTSGGILIDAAEKAGFTKFVFIGTKVRDYIRPDNKRPRMVRQAFRRYPKVAEAMIARPPIYNEAKQRVLKHEKAGEAYCFFPDKMPLSSGTLDQKKIQASYALGQAQINREWPAMKEFLEG